MRQLSLADPDNAIGGGIIRIAGADTAAVCQDCVPESLLAIRVKQRPAVTDRRIVLHRYRKNYRHSTINGEGLVMTGQAQFLVVSFVPAWFCSAPSRLQMRAPI
jgi:hypothetical protein